LPVTVSSTIAWGVFLFGREGEIEMSIDWIFGEYKILKKIATGGMAEVFLAKRVGVKGFEKLLAIKRILPQFSENEDFIAMFIDEAKLAAQLNHRNIVQIYDFGNQQGSYYIAMEYVFGKDLRTVLKKSKDKHHRLPLTQCAYIIAEAARGLEFAHNLEDPHGNPLSIIHRDISPQNIFISYEGDVKIADFGIAKAASKSTETRAGVLKGKILYMSPEQAWGKTIDRRSDLYSLGVLLYEMVADRKIVEADSEFSMLEKVRNAEVDFPPQVFEKIPNRLSDIIKKALEKDPENRYQTAHEMRVDLESYLLTSKETLSEKMISEYLKDLFRDEIVEERKILLEGQGAPEEKTVSIEPAFEPKPETPGKTLPIGKDWQEIEPLEKKRGSPSIKEALRMGDVRTRVGILLILCILGGIVSFYLFSENSPNTTTTTSEGGLAPPSTPVAPPSTVETTVDHPTEKPKTVEKKPSSPEVKLSPPLKEKSKTAEKKPPSPQVKPSSPSKEVAPPPSPTPKETPPRQETKTAGLPAKETGSTNRVPVPLSSLVDRGPVLLRENNQTKLLEDIDKLSTAERQDTKIIILECFAHLKNWILLKDKNSKAAWANLYKLLEHSEDRTATPLLIEIVKDSENWTRLYAVVLLGNIGDRRALNDLEGIAANDPNWKIRRSARKAISLIEKKE
jgi:serine/threonine protein kinase